MDVFLKTAPTADPVSVSELRGHSRIDGNAEDSELYRALLASIQYVEQYSSLKLAPQLLTAKLDQFTAEIELPYGPITSVDEIRYFDVDGAAQTLDSSVYAVYPRQRVGARLVRRPDQSWPDTQTRPHAVEIDYTAGFVNLAPSAFQAVVLLAAHYYENREATAKGMVPKQIAFGVHALLDGIGQPTP